MESPGGSVFDGIEMAKLIRYEGYKTIVRSSCASACSLMFLGGVERELFGSSAKIGLHQPKSTRENDSWCLNSIDDPAVKAMRSLIRFTVPDHANEIYKITVQTSCNKITWISGQNAIDLGIATTLGN